MARLAMLYSVIHAFIRALLTNHLDCISKAELYLQYKMISDAWELPHSV